MACSLKSGPFRYWRCLIPEVAEPPGLTADACERPAFFPGFSQRLRENMRFLPKISKIRHLVREHNLWKSLEEFALFRDRMRWACRRARRTPALANRATNNLCVQMFKISPSAVHVNSISKLAAIANPGIVST
jgi:hypothetical protein